VGKCFLKKIVILLIALGGLLVTGCAVLTNGLSGSLYIESSKVQQIIDKAEYPAKRMQELKDDPVGAPLVKSYEMFAALMEQKNMDSSLVDSMRLSRRAFFEPWKRVSDSMNCPLKFAQFTRLHFGLGLNLTMTTFSRSRTAFIMKNVRMFPSRIRWSF